MTFITSSGYRFFLAIMALLLQPLLSLAKDSSSNNNLFLRGSIGSGSGVNINNGNDKPSLQISFNAAQQQQQLNFASSASASDEICSKYGTAGWHDGTYGDSLLPEQYAPNGVAWTWEQCAAECCKRDPLSECSFWTLRTSPDSDGACIMMTNQGAYSDTEWHKEGDRDEDCCSLGPATPGAWRFVWSDEFNGTYGDPLNSNTWGYETGYVRNSEAQYYSTRLENSRIDSNGMALIEARRDSWNGHQYTSASRTTKGKKSFLYGRFSLRAKINVRPGSWPAWWWLPDTGGWPQGGEVDMMEFYQNKVLFNVMDGNQRWTSIQPSLDTFPGGPQEFAKHFHTWTFDWSPEKIKLYLDGVLMNDYDVANADSTGPGGENPFRRPGYLLINQAIGGTAGGDPSNTDFPVQYRIDWIRQWTWDESVAVENGVSVTVNNGAGSGVYEVGTKATAAVGQPVVGQVFDSWSVLSGSGIMLDDPTSETTTFTVSAGNAGEDVILEANFVSGNPPTESPVAGPTPAPVQPQDGECSKYSTEGWHRGIYEKVMLPNEAPFGWWSWEECARECALFESCTFWTLQLGSEGKCLLMSNQGEYVVSSNHAEGDKDLDCAFYGTPLPTMPPTASEK